MQNSKCPVPKDQQPINEFIELTNSKIFSLPKFKTKFFIVLMGIWFITFLIFIVISSGSVFFNANLYKYLLLSLFSSLSLPLLLTIRLYLGWNHIYKRLIAENIEYEESGWYDGQIWIKPLELRQKESIIASQEVKPILKKLTQTIASILILVLTGISFFQYFKI
tara:strand:- start:1007 stop:1501 length:495 start_codon:yes stop_codon:yes gene_type:complete